jgi:hypothetical protein
MHIVPEALSQEVKRPGRETDYLLPSSAVGSNVWNCVSISPCVFMALVCTRATLLLKKFYLKYYMLVIDIHTVGCIEYYS